jgi:hypothetical protein
MSDDNLHLNIKEIHEELKILAKETIESSYDPDTSWVIKILKIQAKRKV